MGAHFMRLETVDPIVKGGLMPVFDVESGEVAMVTPELAGISVRDIGPVVSSVKDRYLDR